MRTLGDIYQRSCFGKRQHPSKLDAMKEAQRMERLEREPFKYYQCDACGLWHVAHREKRYA